MKELHKFNWYAERISPNLPKKVFQPVPTRLLGGFIYLVATIAGFLVIGLFDLNIWIYFIVALILGCNFAAMGFLGHEILHGTVIKKSWLKDFLGAIAFLPLSTGPKLWIKWHNANHHAYTQHEDRDPDSWLTLDQLNRYSFIRLIYKLPISVRSLVDFLSLSITFSIHSFRMFLRYIKDFKSTKQLVVWTELIVPWAVWVALLFFIGPKKWFFAYLLPLLIGNFIVMAYISTNHRLNPLVSVNDPLANSLTVTVPKFMDVLHFNFSYHTEHHLFPGVNPKYYPLVKEQIKSMWPERYHEMPLHKALKALWKTPRVYYKNIELIDPHRENVYGSLGNGLDLVNINHRRIDIEVEGFVSKGSTAGNKIS